MTRGVLRPQANWTGVVEEARAALAMDPLTLCALRAEAFEVVKRLAT